MRDPQPFGGEERQLCSGQNRKRTAKRAAWLLLGILWLLLIPFLGDVVGLSGVSWSSTVLSLVSGLDPAIQVAHGSSEHDVLSMDYISSRSPPAGFEAWVRFAQQNQCFLGPYERIEKDLMPFRGEAPSVGISQSQLEAAKKLESVAVFTIKKGRLQYSSNAAGSLTSKMVRLMSRFVEFLPDMEFVVNGLDEPRILPGEVDDVNTRLSSEQCKNASEDFRLFRHLHGAINSRPQKLTYRPAKQLLPVFSQSKINDCYADITYPTLYNLDNLLTPKEERAIPPWHLRNGTLFFRGATSGGHYSPGVDFRQAHRQRLVDAARGKPHMDIAFSDFLQCKPEICEMMRQHYGQGNRVRQTDNFEYKYLMSIDGNTFVSRLPLFMSSGSVPFRAGIFSEWYDEWLEAGVHYLRVKLDYSDLEKQLRWATQNDNEARMIGQRARAIAKTRLRNHDMECYLFRLLLEYASILETPKQ